jgi:hypothetical protein
MSGEVGKRRRPLAEILIVGPRRLALARQHARDFVRRADGQWLQGQRVDQAEDGRVAADRHRQRQDDDDGEAGITAD